MLCATSVQAQMPASPLTITGTKIIEFAPPLPSGGNAKEGSCWAESIAAPRPDAWRCSVGNSISDPCFTVARNPEQLVCGADPALRSDGFILKLTKPLPKKPHGTRKVAPWIFQLSDGSICEAMSGTVPTVNGEPARWSCAIHVRDQVRPRGVVTTLTPGKIWMADKFPDERDWKTGRAAGESPGEDDLAVKCAATCASCAVARESASSAIRRRRGRSGRADRRDTSAGFQFEMSYVAGAG